MNELQRITPLSYRATQKSCKDPEGDAISKTPVYGNAALDLIPETVSGIKIETVKQFVDSSQAVAETSSHTPNCIRTTRTNFLITVQEEVLPGDFPRVYSNSLPPEAVSESKDLMPKLKSSWFQKVMYGLSTSGTVQIQYLALTAAPRTLQASLQSVLGQHFTSDFYLEILKQKNSVLEIEEADELKKLIERLCLLFGFQGLSSLRIISLTLRYFTQDLEEGMSFTFPCSIKRTVIYET
ncbi:hypothetical protein E5288_WYG021470 [Bos mutus]|uniref:Uncharacterized protein n=1 Tax=Bos mutus TaxID=72004 RepID=A0A6B0R796_9CETA|nr:hypothetical protein [Bos mutus]